MVKLTGTQLILLAAAANRDGGSILPMPGTLKLNRETADGVLKELLKKKLVAERPATGPATVWPDSKAGGPVTLAITPAGLRAIAAEATVFKKKLGLRIVSAKEARGRVYRMAAPGK